MHKRATIKDIATEAGVSIGTVDRVLHDRGNVAPDVAANVKRVMTKLGFERNIAASALAYNKTHDVVAVLPKSISDFYWVQPRLGIEKAHNEVRHFGLNITFIEFDLFDPDDFADSLSKALCMAPAGIIFPPLFYAQSNDFLVEAALKNIPVVTINTMIEEQSFLTYIGQNSFQSGVLAGRLLNFSQHDHCTFLLLHLEKDATYARHLLDKEAGFRHYFTSNGYTHINIVKKEFESFNDEAALKTFVLTTIDQLPNLKGIFVSNSRAYYIAELFKNETKDDLKIVGFDLLPKNIELLKSNKIDFLINQNSDIQGYESLMALYRHIILKKPNEHLNYLPLDIVVPENIEYYIKSHIDS
jgi:LacI family transcriptional regulator